MRVLTVASKQYLDVAPIPLCEGDSQMPDTKREADNLLVISFLSLRKAVGIIGLLLPFVVALGNMLLDGGALETSISAYYYTVMRDVLVGSLCAIGVFLFSYRGYDRNDQIAGKVASVTAIAAALFPTNPKDALTGSWTGRIHFTSAVILFLTLAVFSLVLFRKTDPNKPMTTKKKQRNRVYVVCGVLILVSIAGAGISFLFRSSAFFVLYTPVFWFESLAVVSFGVSWLTKGEAILADE
jgi:hypothetical protein